MRFLYAALVARFMHGWGRAFCFVLCYSSLSVANAGMTTDVALPRVVKSGWDVVYQATVGGVPASGGIGPRTYTPAGDVWGDVLQTEKGWLTRDGAFTRTAPSVEATITRRVPWASVSRIAAKTLPVVGAASLAYDIWTALRCKFEDGQIKCDDGVPPNISQGGTIQKYQWKNTNGGDWFDSAVQACTPFEGYTFTVTYFSADSAGCMNQYNQQMSSVYRALRTVEAGGDISCPNPSHFVGVDGKCPTGNYSPKSEDDAADHFGKNAPKVPGASEKAPGIVSEGDKHGKGAPAGEPSITGPASQQGPASNQTTTGPSGTTTVTTQPTYNYTYGPYSVTYTTTNVTTQTVTNNAGDTITNTTTETDAQPKDERSECEKNPDTVGCTPLGEVPDEEVTKLTREVSVTAEAVNLPAQCPAPIDAAGYSLSFDAACDFSEGVHPFVLAAAALMAGLIVIRSIQGA